MPADVVIKIRAAEPVKEGGQVVFLPGLPGLAAYNGQVVPDTKLDDDAARLDDRFEHQNYYDETTP